MHQNGGNCYKRDDSPLILYSTNSSTYNFRCQSRESASVSAVHRITFFRIVVDQFDCQTFQWCLSVDRNIPLVHPSKTQKGLVRLAWASSNSHPPTFHSWAFVNFSTAIWASQPKRHLCTKVPLSDQIIILYWLPTFDELWLRTRRFRYGWTVIQVSKFLAVFEVNVHWRDY